MITLNEYLINKNNVKSSIKRYDSESLKEKYGCELVVDDADDLDSKSFMSFVLFNYWDHNYSKYDLKILVGDKPIRISRRDGIKRNVIVDGYLPNENGEFPTSVRPNCSTILNKTLSKKNWKTFKEEILNKLL